MLWAFWRTVWPLALGGVLVVAGARWRRRGVALALAVAVGGGAAVSYGLSLAWPEWRLISGAWLGPLGGEPTLACWAGFLLVGVIAGLPERRSSARVLAMAALALGALLVMNGPCALYWHGHAVSQANYPRADGLLAQSTPWTCTPSSSAMLLARNGLRVSEGELAERVGTSPMMGTDPIALAKALRRWYVPARLRVRVAKLDYAAAKALGRPFVASIKLPRVGGHSLLVERIDAAGVHVADPLGGRRRVIAPARWLEMWKDVCIWLEPAGQE